MKARDLFIVNFGLRLWLTSVGVTNPILQDICAKVLGAILGELIDKGILVIDLTADAIKIALQDKQYRKAAEEAYAHATARVYTEAEKAVIRQQYLDVIDKFVSVGNRVRDSKNS